MIDLGAEYRPRSLALVACGCRADVNIFSEIKGVLERCV